MALISGRLIEEYPTLHPSTPAGAKDMNLDMFCRHLNDTLGVAWDRAGIAAFHFHFLWHGLYFVVHFRLSPFRLILSGSNTSNTLCSI
jgi:hypothetical protein